MQGKKWKRKKTQSVFVIHCQFFLTWVSIITVITNIGNINKFNGLIMFNIVISKLWIPTAFSYILYSSAKIKSKIKTSLTFYVSMPRILMTSFFISPPLFHTLNWESQIFSSLTLSLYTFLETWNDCFPASTSQMSSPLPNQQS